MPKKTSDSKDQLEEILEHLRHIDRRDRLRMWGSFFRGVIGIIPTIAFIYGLWYFYHHGDEVLSKVTQQAAEQAMRMTQESSDGLIDQLNEKFSQFLVK